MTSEERLAIAEEIAAQVFNIKLGELEFYRHGFGYRAKHVETKEIIAHESTLIDTIHQARQKLAAERESKKSPREKRLEAIVHELLNTHYPPVYSYGYGCLYERAMAALKEDA